MNGDRPITRLAPEIPFPPYTYIPRSGLPHPTSDPSGHSFGLRPDPPAGLDPDRWRESQPYLFGIDLFHGGFFWEAHEVWEGLWHASGRRGVVADFLKGLIKLAAAGVKHREGVPNGTRTHARRAAELWRGVDRSLGWGPERDTFLGLRLGGLIALAEGIERDGWPSSPVALMPADPPVPG
jgi:hypothetical protein